MTAGTSGEKKAGNAKDVIGVRIDKPVKRRLRRMARADNRSLSQYIAMVLTEHASKQEARQ